LTPPLVVPARTVYLLDGYTTPESRGTGVATALLAEAMRWARSAGHEHCLLHYVPANPVARRFWLGSGFRPVKYRLSRRIDERVLWAGARAG
jgi:GNAT superfamily N-acetyltransferase